MVATFMSDSTSCTDVSETEGTFYKIEEIHEYEKIFYQRHLCLKSGKISRLWDEQHDVWIFWKPKPVAQKPSIIFNKLFTHRFRGNNRGRHFDRKRRD